MRRNIPLVRDVVVEDSETPQLWWKQSTMQIVVDRVKRYPVAFTVQDLRDERTPRLGVRRSSPRVRDVVVEQSRIPQQSWWKWSTVRIVVG